MRLGAGAPIGGALAAACGTTGQPGAGETTAPTAPAGTATYLFHGGQGWELDQYLDLGKKFQERHPTMQVDVTFGQGSYLTKLQAMVSAGDPPDATFVANWYIPEYAERGLLRPLAPYLSRDRIDLKRFFDATDRNVFLDALESDTQISQPLLPVSIEIETLIRAALEPVWKGESDARTVLQSITPQVNGLIAPR